MTFEISKREPFLNKIALYNGKKPLRPFIDYIYEEIKINIAFYFKYNSLTPLFLKLVFDSPLLFDYCAI